MMRSDFVRILLMLLLLSLLSCNKQPKVSIERLSELAQFQLNDEKYILVIPQNGCSTCVKKSYEFILKNWNSRRVKYVFTHYSSKKAIRIRFRVLGIEDSSPLAFIDLGSALELGMSQIYPSLITIREGDSGSVVYMNAQDGSDWLELQRVLTE